MKYWILILLLGAAILTLFFVDPIPQPLEYHNFADQRTFYGIPNFFDVASNIFFILIGGYGLYYLFRPNARLKRAFFYKQGKLFYIVFFFGLFLIGFGSSYYHWHPSNWSLIWDRLPISVVFMSLFSAVLAERINFKLGLYLLFPLVLFGLVSVSYWGYTESIGAGDLRLYLLVLFFPIIALPFLLGLFKPFYTHQSYIWLAWFSYILAMVSQELDTYVYRLSYETVSGHTIKHLLAALGSLFIFIYISKRKPIND